MLIKKLLLITTPELCLGVLLIFSSSIGQTFFISLFSGEIRNEFNLSHGTFGIFYSVATLMSAIVFFWLGKFTNRCSGINAGSSLFCCYVITRFSIKQFVCCNHGRFYKKKQKSKISYRKK